MQDQSSADKLQGGLTRRNALLMLGAATTALYAGAGAAAVAGHDHSKHAARHGDLLEAVNDCLDAGRRCIAHCLVSFQEGDTELADCAAKVHEMQAVCEAYAYLLSANSSYAKDYSAVCKPVCSDCKRECEKHDQHVECKACAEACAEVVKQIEAAFA